MIRAFLFAGLLLTCALTVSSQTGGTVTFSVTTVSNGGQYTPENIVAIWIKNSAGTFIRSMKVMAAQRIQYLYQWKLSSSMNTVNAITGATLSTHQTHVVSWNCKDKNNSALVPDGDYEFWVEFTDDDLQGPVTHYTFTKGSASQNINFPDASRFVNVSLVYTPDPAGLNDVIVPATVQRTAGSDRFVFSIPSQIEQNASIQIFDVSGKMVYSSSAYLDNDHERYFIWNAYSQQNGIYIYRIESGAKLYAGKLFK